jgi:hypothetical protein
MPDTYRQTIDETIDRMFRVWVTVSDMRDRGTGEATIALAVWEESQEITRTLEKLFESEEI